MLSHSCDSLGQIGAEDGNLFTYPSQQTYLNYTRPDFIPIFEPTFATAELEAKAKQLCGGNKQCLIDFAMTGDESVALSTQEQDKTYTNNQEILGEWNTVLSLSDGIVGTRVGHSERS